MLGMGSGRKIQYDLLEKKRSKVKSKYNLNVVFLNHKQTAKSPANKEKLEG